MRGSGTQRQIPWESLEERDRRSGGREGGGERERERGRGGGGERERDRADPQAEP